MSQGHPSRVRSLLGVFGAVLALVAAFAAYLVLNPPSPYQDVIISEVQTSNGQTLMDSDGEYSDWIEIENRGATRVNLEGVTVGRGDGRSWIFPQVWLEPGDSTVVWMSSKDRGTPGEELHASFRLSRNGVDLTLSTPQGAVFDVLGVPALARDGSFGRHPVATSIRCYFPAPTPGQPNSGMCVEEESFR